MTFTGYWICKACKKRWKPTTHRPPCCSYCGKTERKPYQPKVIEQAGR